MTGLLTEATSPAGAEPEPEPEADWAGLLSSAPAPTPVAAQRYIEGPIAQSFSRPHLYLGDDGEEYVVKLPRPGQRRALASDQVVGRAGQLLDAPVGQVVAIGVDPELLPEGEDESAAGVAHGCKRISNILDGANANIDANRGRMAKLAVLYTWTRGSDHQLIWEQAEPAPLVHSVDHGHFLPPSNDWQATSLNVEPMPMVLDLWFTNQGIKSEDCSEAIAALHAVTREQVAEVVRSARMEWEISDDDRQALCGYLWSRRAATLSLVGAV